MKRILINAQVCSGCRACEVSCVAHHENVFGAAAARIRVSKIESQGIDRPHVCWQCQRALCMEACPVEALIRDEQTGAVLLLEGECIGCGECVAACPFVVALLPPENGLALICDLCDGDPSCVKRCATGAIVYAEPNTAAAGKRYPRAVQLIDKGE